VLEGIAAPAVAVEPATTHDDDAVATQALARPTPSSPASPLRAPTPAPPSPLRSPTPMPLPQLLDEARAAREEASPRGSTALHATAIAVALVLVVALLFLLKRYQG
jgi:hypothetical protein